MKNKQFKRLPQRTVSSYKEVEFCVYNITWLAIIIDRDPHTIRRWEYNKVIPRPIFKIGKVRRRWYCGLEINAYAKIFRQCDLRKGRSIDSTRFAEQCKTMHVVLQRKIETSPRILLQGVVNEEEIVARIKLINEAVKN